MKIKFAVLLLSVVFLLSQPTSSNVIFRFSLGFDLGGNNSDETFNRTLIIDDNGITIKDNVEDLTAENGEAQEHISTVTASWEGLETEVKPEDSPINNASDAPLDRYNVSDAVLDRYNAVAIEQLPAIRTAMSSVNKDLLPLVGRNDEIAAKVKLITRLLNEVNEILALTNTQRWAKMQALDNFLGCMEKLEHSEGHTNDVEKLLMQLLFTKHGLNELRSKVRDELNFIEDKV